MLEFVRENRRSNREILTRSNLQRVFSSYGEEFEDTKGVIRIHKSKNTMPKRKRTIKDLQNIHIKLRTPQKTGGKLRCSGRVDSSRSTSGIRTVLI